MTIQTPSTIFSSIQTLKGIGERRTLLLEKIGLATIQDLLTFFPRKYINREKMNRISDLTLKTETTAIGQVQSFRVIFGRKSRFILNIKDDSGALRCVWFHGYQYLKDKFKIGEWIAVHGKVKFYNGLQMVHPEYDHLADQSDKNKFEQKMRPIIPLYHSTQDLSAAGLDSRGFRRILWSVLLSIHLSLMKHCPETFLTDINF